VHIDRIASAWLIRRFIDPEARFKFVAARAIEAAEGELRFDMFQAEFTHEGDKCSSRSCSIVSRARIRRSAPFAEIIHDVDLKDSKFGREEAIGIRTLIDGIACDDIG